MHRSFETLLVTKTFTNWSFAIFSVVGLIAAYIPVIAVEFDAPSASITCEVVEFCARTLNRLVSAALAGTMLRR
jgi:hypothetical protein